MATATKTTLSDEIKTHYVMRLLMRAVPRLVHGRFGQRATLARRQGNTLEWRKFGALSVVTAALGEDDFGYGGTIPAPQSPTVTTVTASPSYYGAYIEYSDDLEFEAIDPVLENFSDVLGEQCGRSVDQLTRGVMQTGFTNVVRTTGVAADANITASHTMNFALWVKALANLQAGEALPLSGEKYAVIIHPHTWADLIQDTTVQKAWEAAAQAGSRNPFESGYIGSLLNTDIYISTNALVVADAGSAATVDVYYSTFIGQEAYGIMGISGREARDIDMGGGDGKQNINLTGQKVRPVELITKPLGYKDPLDEIGTVAWKVSHVAKVLQVPFAVQVRHAASLGTNT